MTDKDIIKALKKHSMDLCSNCKVEKTTLCNDCISEIERNALDLINRQQAEIERLKGWQDLSNEIQQHYKVEIVRCKDCVLKFESNDGYVYCHHTGMPIKQNGYCDWGTKGINAHPTEKGGGEE